MTTNLVIEDKTSFNFKTAGLKFILAVAEQRLTIRELIRARIYQEVNTYNAQQPEFFRTLIRPTEAEETLNGFRLPIKRLLNPADQFSKAIQAFEANGFIVLIDGHQAESLEEVIEVTPDLSVAFFKLVPLVGG